MHTDQEREPMKTFAQKLRTSELMKIMKKIDMWLNSQRKEYNGQLFGTCGGKYVELGESNRSLPLGIAYVILPLNYNIIK